MSQYIIVGDVYYDSGGNRIEGGDGKVSLRDAETGERWDFTNSEWTLTPAQPVGDLLEDENEVGYYKNTLDKTNWGRRVIDVFIQLYKEGYSDQARTYQIQVSGFSSPIPEAGQTNLVLPCLNSGGTPMATAPTASCKVLYPMPPADEGPVEREGTWDAEQGTWNWVVPQGSVNWVSCLDVGVLGAYEVFTASQYIVTEMNPIG